MDMAFQPGRYRTIWISDIHLGTRGCKAELLLEFLRHTHAETLFLVGDIVDGWRLKRSWYWNQSHNDVVQKLLRKARKGTNVIYVPGNHDEALRDFTELQFGGITVQMEAIHQTADGRRLLVTHGDHFDGIVTYAKWLALLGDAAYGFALNLSRAITAALPPPGPAPSARRLAKCQHVKAKGARTRRRRLLQGPSREGQALTNRLQTR